MRRPSLAPLLALPVALLLTACEREPTPPPPSASAPTAVVPPAPAGAPVPPIPPPGSTTSSATATTTVKEGPTMLKVGDPAPAFSVPDHTGKQRTLAEFAGKRVVLWFYPRAETSGCTVEGCAFRDHHAEFVAKDVVVLGVSVDPIEANRKFVENQKFPFALLSDTDRKMSVAYGAAAGLDAKYSNRITVVIGPDGKVEQVVDKVAVATHAKSLLESFPK